ncbi:MAG: tryptophan-rich sensory protein [Anaerolineae bacterium]|nr:hypothetical protein [Caldilineales bacterium]MDW8270261.1 tryptophan-rich sensory protein [Anaerolineae bacterium]
MTTLTSPSLATTHEGRRLLPFLNVLFFVLTLLVNGLSSVGLLNGRTPAEISDSLPSFFTPANFTFAIWSVIYLGLSSFIVYQALPSQRANPQLAGIGPWFILASLGNMGWIFAWHWGYYVLTVPLMLLLLVALMVIYVRLGIGLPAAQRPYPVTRADRWFIHTPFSLYLAWITVANIANAATTLVSLGWDGFGLPGPVWAAILVVTAALVTVLVLRRRTDYAFAGVILWALLGIFAKQGAETVIAVAVAIAAILIIGALILSTFRSRMAQMTPKS